MKTLASCSPKEFLIQTNKIRKHVANWLTLTKVMEIRKNLPTFEDNADEKTRRAAMEKQVKKNISDILDSILESYPEETAELLGLLCFVEPADLDKHKMTEFFGGLAEILNSREVMDFFMSLVQLGRRAGF